MRYIALSLFIFTSSVFAIDCEDYSPFNFYTFPGAIPLGFSLKGSELDSGPKWDTKSEPPLSMLEALAISNKSVSELELAFKLEYFDISLRRFGCNPTGNHYYDIEYGTYDSKNRFFGSYHLLVLMNGTVKWPIPVTVIRY